jgi:hypothetical protein
MRDFEAFSTAIQATGFAGAIDLIAWLAAPIFPYIIPRLVFDLEVSR